MGMSVSIGNAQAPGTVTVVATDPAEGGVILSGTADVGADNTGCSARALIAEDGRQSLDLKCN